METEIGKIASLLKSTQEKKTPLQESLDNFGKKLSLIIIGICVIVLGLELFRSDGINLTVFTDDLCLRLHLPLRQFRRL